MRISNRFSRTNILAFILLSFMAVFVLRLFWLQVIKHDQYAMAARNSQQRNFIIPAERGQIYMRDGTDAPVPVVLNQTVYSVIADPAVIESEEIDMIIDELENTAGGEVLDGFSSRLKNKGSRYEILAKNITRTQAEKIKSKKFSGILLQKNSSRSYPENQLGAHVLGFVNADGIGQYGVEGGLDDDLSGKDGVLQTVTDVRDIPLTVGKDNTRVEPQSGKTVILTIDRNIQSFTEIALKNGVEKAGATEGSALVMDPKNGQILAMADYPTYDPAEYSRVKDASVYANSSTSLIYEPASVIKPFLIATAIDKGVVNADSTYLNTDCIQVQDRSMCNTLRGLGGITTVQGILNNSLNVGTITVARRMGNGSSIDPSVRRTIYDYYHDKFGFGSKTGVEINESAGSLISPDDADGNEVRYSNMTFGQGMLATTLQIASAYCSLVNGGEYFDPTLIYGWQTENGEVKLASSRPSHRAISTGTSSSITQMLNVARGSSWMGRGDASGYIVGGKTGTAESIVNGLYTANETVGTYIGHGATKTPEYVIIVRVAAPGKGLNLEGGLHASPIFTEISNNMINYLKLSPGR